MKINNKIKQALWQNWWKPDKIERKLTNKRLEVFSDNQNKNIIWKKKKKIVKEFDIWDKVVISLFDILKPEIFFFPKFKEENKKLNPPLVFVYLVVEIKNKQYNKAKKVKYTWKFIEVLEYDYCCPTSDKRIKEEDIKAMNEWIKENLSWEIIFKNIQKLKTREIKK